MADWNGLMRSDGTCIVPVRKTWVIVTAPDNAVIGCCPCCQMLLRSEAEAKNVADLHYPPSHNRDA